MKAFYAVAMFLVTLCVACGAQHENTDSPTGIESVTATPQVSSSTLPILKVFPLELGRTWVYSATEVSAPIELQTGHKAVFVNHTGTFTETVIDMQYTNNSIVFTTTIQRAPSLLDDPFDQIREYEVVDNAIFFDHHITMLRWPIATGQKWDAFGDVAEDFKGVYFWKVLKQGDITVPAGHFTDCFQLTLMTGPDDSIDWFCPGIGMVSREYHHHGTVDIRYWELQSTKLQ